MDFVLQKPCGDCVACCSGPLVVPEYGISEGKPCEHLCEAGCGIYEDRAEICRVFSCVWKTNFVPDDLRPDKSGVICKWTDDGSMLLVPTGDKAPQKAIGYWRAWARKMKQPLGLHIKETGETKVLLKGKRVA